MKIKIKIRTADDLRKFRLSKGLKQCEFAKKTGISTSAISKKEVGDRNITLLDEFKINAVKW